MAAECNEQDCSPEDLAAVQRWLEKFAGAVRAKDFAAGRALCQPHVFSFCTVVSNADGLDELESRQWRGVWNATHGFKFDLSSLRCGGRGGVFWAASTWSSFGKDAHQQDFLRCGRATIILQGHGPDLRAVHTHFSLEPA